MVRELNGEPALSVAHGQDQAPNLYPTADSMRVRETIRNIEADGWRVVAQKGSHRQFKHPLKPGRVTIAGRLADELSPGTLNSIRKQAGLLGGNAR